MVWAAPALAAATLCLRVSTDPVKAAVAALIIGAVLSNAEHPHLEALVCDLEPGTILASHPDILDKLKLCPALTGAQQDALNALLLSGDTAYGDPSSWDLHTLQDLGPLVLALNETTLSLVAEAAREDFRRSIEAAYTSQGHSQREKSLILLRALAAASAASHPRLKRSADRCWCEPITSNNIEDVICYLFPDPLLDQLDLCLSNDVLIKNLEDVLELPFPSNLEVEVLQVLKKKVDEFYPSGIPEEQLRRLGKLSRLYTEQEIRQWPVTSSDTLSALLNSSGGEWNDSQVQQLVSTYLAQGGSLTGPLLQEIGGERLCSLQEEQIQKIPAGAIGTAGPLNISSCSQTKKEQFYGKAREAFASLACTPGPYYCQIQPYLGGAPAKHLKDLANTFVAINMDLATFLSLNPKELQKLSITEVKCLLGENVSELKKAKQEPLVLSWLQQQSLQELNCVPGISLQGTASPAATSPATVTSPVPTTPTSVTSTATVTTPVPTTPTSVTSMATGTTPVPTTSASVTSMATVPTSPHPATSASVTPVPTTPTSVTSTVTVTTPVPTTPTSVTSMATVTTPVPTTSASVTSMATVPTSPHPATSANVTPVSTTLPTVPSTSASVTSMTTVPTPPHPSPSVTVPTPTAISSHSTPQPSTVPPRTPTPSTLGPAPPDTPTHTGGPTVPTVPPTARPALTSAVPCSTHQAPSTDSATSPTVTLLSTLLATSSPSATPAPAVTSRATTSTSAGTNLAATTHSTVTPVPNSTSAPTATPVPNPTSAPTATTVPNPSSALTVTHSSATPVPNPTSSPTATTVPNPTSSPTVTSTPSCALTATPVPNPSSAPTATHSTATTVPNPTSSPTATPVPHSSSAPTVTHSTATPVPNPTSSPTATPAPHTPTPFPISTQTSLGSSTAKPTAVPVPCQPSSPPSPTPTPGSVPESSRPTSNGIINLQPEPGSGSRLCSCLVLLLAATTGSVLLL